MLAEIAARGDDPATAAAREVVSWGLIWIALGNRASPRWGYEAHKTIG